MAQQVLTTSENQQETGRIVVVAKRDGELNGIELGHFALDGIKPSRQGMAVITVTFKLVNELHLQCTAFYKAGNRKVHLAFKDKTSLRAVKKPA